MTHDDARTYFFEQLPLVRNSEDLLRLTLWVLPHLDAKPDRPLGAIETMQLQLQLECSNYAKDTTRVWWHCTNRDVSAQLKALQPIYTDGSSGPNFCSGLTPKMVLSNGPSPKAAGLSLGVYATEHAQAKAALDAAPDMHTWWTTFMEHTPLWMRTAFNWHKPTEEQQRVLAQARTSMLLYVPELVANTELGYNNITGNVKMQFQTWKSKRTGGVKAEPYWVALMAGQSMLGVDHNLSFTKLERITPGVQQTIRELGMIVCSLRGLDELNDKSVRTMMEQATAARNQPPASLPLPELSVPNDGML